MFVLASYSGKFIASMVRVSSTEDVSEVFAQMKSDRNFGSATHIITAVRIRTPDNKLVFQMPRIYYLRIRDD